MSTYQPRNAYRRGGLPKLLALLMPILLILGGLIVTPPEAQAAGPHYVGYQVTLDGITTTIGTYESLSGSGGHRVICIDTSADHPSSLKSPSSVKDARINYLMLKYIDQTSSNVTAAALAEIVKMAYDENQSMRKKAWAKFKDQKPTAYANVSARMTELNAEADKYAGAFTLTPTLTATSGGKGTVSFGIKAASGSYFPGVNITLTAKNAVFTSNNAATLTVTSTSSAQTAELKASSGNAVSVTAVTDKDLASVYFKKYPASTNSDQDMAGANFTTTSVSGSASIDTFLAAPTLTSTVGSSYADVGATLTDTVSLSGGSPGDTITVNTTVYGPLSSQPTVSALAPSGTPVFQTLSKQVTLDSSGAATAAFTSKATTAAGYYVWVESTEATAGDEAATSTYGRASETTSVGSPTVATTVSDRKSRVGDEISDTVVISNLNLVTNATTPLTATLTGQLLGPVDAINKSCTGVTWAGAPVAATIAATPVTKNGSTAGVGKFTITDVGCYTYAYTLTGVANSKTVWTVQHAAGQASQTSLATADLALSSQVADQVVVNGNPLADTVRVKGLPDGETVTIRSTLYGPLDTLPAAESDTVPPGTPIVEQFSQDLTGDGTGDQQVIFTTSSPVTADGYYVWVESSDESADAVVEAVTSTFGRPNETSRIVTPSVSTQASAQKTTLNSTISDTVTVAGVEETLAMASAASVSGAVTLSGSLLGPIDPVNGSCQGLDWSGAPVAADIPDRDVTKNGDLTGIGSFTVADPGCYTYTEKLTAQVGGGTAWQLTHSPGKAAQTVLAAAPSMATQTSDALVGVDAQITDSVIVTNMGSNTGTITARLYGPYYLDDAAKCTDITAAQWQAAIDDGSMGASDDQTITVPADGTYTTEPVATVEAGCYTWWEQLDVGNPASPSYTTISPLGVASETTTVVSPTITTTAVSGKNDVTLFDTVQIAGTHGMTGTVTGSILGPLPRNSALTCDSLDWSTASKVADIAPITVTGDGTYPTKAATLTDSGCYTFVETLTMDDPTVPAVTTDPGIFNETLYLVPTTDGGGGGGGNGITSGEPGGPAGLPIVFGGALALVGLLLALAGMRKGRRRNS